MTHLEETSTELFYLDQSLNKNWKNSIGSIAKEVFWQTQKKKKRKKFQKAKLSFGKKDQKFD